MGSGSICRAGPASADIDDFAGHCYRIDPHGVGTRGRKRILRSPRSGHYWWLLVSVSFTVFIVPSAVYLFYRKSKRQDGLEASRPPLIPDWLTPPGSGTAQRVREKIG